MVEYADVVATVQLFKSHRDSVTYQILYNSEVVLPIRPKCCSEISQQGGCDQGYHVMLWNAALKHFLSILYSDLLHQSLLDISFALILQKEALGAFPLQLMPKPIQSPSVASRDSYDTQDLSPE